MVVSATKARSTVWAASLSLVVPVAEELEC
jgi:hypothetical protein